MPDQELDDILASMEQIVRQAYALGRSEALKKVIDVLKADTPSAPALALSGPAHEAAPSVKVPPPEGTMLPLDHASEPVAEPAKDNRGTVTDLADALPWYKRPARR